MSQTGFRVSVVCDSVWQGVRLTTFACRFPRVILSEINTHRAISKNAASSRAIPATHFIEQVETDPYIPGDLPDGEWCGNGPGMVANAPMQYTQKLVAGTTFLRAAKSARRAAVTLESLGVHKQDVNRILEPFQWVRWVGTATDWSNFFALRTDHRAYPPFRFLARCMWTAFQRSVPVERSFHLPFISDDDIREASVADDVRPGWLSGHASVFAKFNAVDSPIGGRMRVGYLLAAWSAARCARVSVKNFRTDSTDRKKDMETFLKLTSETPRHASPLEHQAFACGEKGGPPDSNFAQPWKQFRKLVPQETIREFSPPADEVAKWNVPDDVFGGTPGVDW